MSKDNQLIQAATERNRPLFERLLEDPEVNPSAQTNAAARILLQHLVTLENPESLDTVIWMLIALAASPNFFPTLELWNLASNIDQGFADDIIGHLNFPRD